MVFVLFMLLCHNLGSLHLADIAEWTSGPIYALSTPNCARLGSHTHAAPARSSCEVLGFVLRIRIAEARNVVPSEIFRIYV